MNATRKGRPNSGPNWQHAPENGIEPRTGDIWTDIPEPVTLCCLCANVTEL